MTTTPLRNLPIEAVRDLQTRLCQLGLLDPVISGDRDHLFAPVDTADGRAGPETRAALFEFSRLVEGGLDYVDGAVTDAQLEALAAAQPDTFLPIQWDNHPTDGTQTRLAKAALRYLQRYGFWIARSPRARNIVYVEGLDADGRANADRPNEWNDRRMVISVINGTPTMLVNDQATTEPGKFYVLNPGKMGQLGAARIAFGQYKAWRMGVHRQSQPALVQRGPVRVHRDVNRNFIRDRRDPIDVGVDFGINQHSTNRHGKEPTLVDDFSAGCLVGRRFNWHLSFLDIVSQDYRYDSHHDYLFLSTVIAGDALAREEGLGK